MDGAALRTRPPSLTLTLRVPRAISRLERGVGSRHTTMPLSGDQN